MEAEGPGESELRAGAAPGAPLGSRPLALPALRRGWVASPLERPGRFRCSRAEKFDVGKLLYSRAMRRDKTRGKTLLCARTLLKVLTGAISVRCVVLGSAKSLHLKHFLFF